MCSWEGGRGGVCMRVHVCVRGVRGGVRVYMCVRGNADVCVGKLRVCVCARVLAGCGACASETLSDQPGPGQVGCTAGTERRQEGPGSTLLRPGSSGRKQTWASPCGVSVMRDQAATSASPGGRASRGPDCWEGVRKVGAPPGV